MGYSISFAAKVEVTDGPSVSFTAAQTVEAYDTIDVTVPAAAAGGAAGTANVEIQPGGTGQVLLLIVTSSIYDSKLTFKVDAGATPIALDAPMFFAGKGAVALLGTTAKTFAFSNAMTKAATVSVLVGRKATT